MNAQFSDEDVRRLRAEFLQPIRAKLEERGAPQAWLARRLGIEPRMLWRYFHGLDRVPPTFVAQACRVMGMPRSRVPLTAPAELLIQHPRGLVARHRTAPNTTLRKS